MALKVYKPNTPGQRGLVQVDRRQLHKGKPVKQLTRLGRKPVHEFAVRERFDGDVFGGSSA